ncbi:hypothetical protein O4215_17065 [Rhodococcus maanshanensis]|uniref:hypothetical protein n=1 Tax=Rhodococcus maanshanensis TaxID=183556 RepID=UPI0022B3911F|nr:hypothetical protein [Rhodococcus maanshanensis]MCZ4557281.1 hypothetical protein [Rhodococcus maanshanensis]
MTRSVLGADALTPSMRDSIVVSEWSSSMPRPTMRRLAATVLASVMLTAGLSAGVSTAATIPANQLPAGSLADATGSSRIDIPSPFDELVIEIIHTVLVDGLGSQEPGPKPGI